jgi:copper homeostasis protein CutC
MDSIAATDRFLMLEHLAHAVRRTHELQSLINRQRERIKILNRAGLNTYTAELVLAQLEQSQTLYSADSTRLECALTKLDPNGTRLRRECRVPPDDSSS